ncbi:DUF4202 domain-containing protein [Flagellimonas sp. S3867]|uniref:DUF4202 domain-containing protein n=1 Tax=Flagellimonas sp. S3867 TaxID=2768063 RepID=UPI001CC229AB|nr:DUF4202 domain-containing protein [Flagellimonas sp. S3867]
MAFQLFDEANSKDPNIEMYNGEKFPKELLYATRMTDTLKEFAPEVSEGLQLAARSQHICRWQIPRSDYEMNRTGYLKWRQDLKKFHAQKTTEILKQLGYESEIIDQVEFLLLKKQLKKNEETQTLEDVVCLVFLRYYFEPFANKHSDEKVVEILQKTWRKMSLKGQSAATKLPISDQSMGLIKKAIANGTE